MRSFLQFIRLLFSVLILLCLPVGIAWIAGGLEVGLFVFALLLLSIFLMSLQIENLILRHFKKMDSQQFKGLAQTWKESSTQLPRNQAPKLIIYVDPAPNALVIRSPFSSGLILMSQGLMDLLTEEELRRVLWVCSVRCRERGFVVFTVSAYISYMIWKVFCRSQANALTPVAGIKAWLGFGFLELLKTNEKSEFHVNDLMVMRSVQKIQKQIRLGLFKPVPGFGHLYLANPQK